MVIGRLWIGPSLRGDVGDLGDERFGQEWERFAQANRRVDAAVAAVSGPPPVFADMIEHVRPATVLIEGYR